MSVPSQYCIYLRKSSADLEAEAHGEGETLARHERMLLELSKRQNLNITQIYREIVSGETIAARPVMQKLLSEVGAGMWSGVLVVEVERLARGDTMDQGLMAQTFKYSGTKIVTPMRTYDPENEFDEEYFEFGLFMSRREYKTINRRLLRGRLASAKEGKFVSGYAPYGYERVRVPHDKGWTLRPSALADNVRLIFRYYTEGEKLDDGSVRRFTLSELAARLDELGIPTPGSSETWQKQGVIRLLSNPVYAGKIRWNYKSGKKQIVDGSVRIKHQKSAPEDVILVDGLHPALVTDEVFCKAQKLISTARAPAVTTEHGLKNPLAGLLLCGKCGKAIIRNHVSEVRGNHAAGIAYNKPSGLTIYKRPKPAHKLHFKLPKGTAAVMGHTRFTTQGSEKQNYNNHPFRGNAGTDFALAHNGVLYNDHELRIMEDLPQTEIETDSYIAVQLLEKQGTLDFDSLRYVGEHVRGSFTFTILDRENALYFIKGESPLYLIHFKELGLYVYTSTPDIMEKALKQTAHRFLPYEAINGPDGDLLKISSDGEITQDTFDLLPEFLPRRAWFPSAMRQYDPEDALEELLEMCGYFGVSEDVVLYLHEMGWSYDEIEQCLWNPEVLDTELMLEEL